MERSLALSAEDRFDALDLDAAGHRRSRLSAPSADWVKAFDGGFTSIIDVAFRTDGKLYAAEFDTASWSAVEVLGEGASGTVNKCIARTLNCWEIAEDIPQLTANTFTKHRELWATRNPLIPAAAEVFRAR